MRSRYRRSSAREPRRAPRGTSTTAWSYACMTGNTLVITVPLSRRESLLRTYPGSFGLPPRMEAHHKVEAYIDRTPRLAVRAAIDLGWKMQRRKHRPKAP